MAPPSWEDTSARRMVASLLAQRQRQAELRATLDRIQYVRAAAFPDPASLVEHLIAQLSPDR